MRRSSRRRFGIEDSGNALADPQGEFRGQNILYVAQSIEDVAAQTGRSPEGVMAALTRIRRTLFDARAARPRPHLDDKIITAWNGLMIAAFARAARVLVGSPRRDEWRQAAERAAGVVRTRLWRPTNGDCGAGIATAKPRWTRSAKTTRVWSGDCWSSCRPPATWSWLSWALELTDVQTELFYDPRDGGWFSTTGDDPTVLLRLKEDYDGAEPAAASVTVRNLITIGHLTGDRNRIDIAGRSLERYGTQIGRVARVMPFMVSNVAFWNAVKSQVVLVGTQGSPELEALETEVARHYLPWTIVIPVDRSHRSDDLKTVLPWAAAMTTRDLRTAAYVCRDFTCQAPVTDAQALAALLE